MSKGKAAKGSATKQIEMRRCVVCRQSFHKSELLRVVKTAAGDISFDETGKAAVGNVTLHPDSAIQHRNELDKTTAPKKIFGRGAYVCKSPECLATLRKRRNFDRVLKAKVPAEIYDKIEGLTKEIIRNVN